MVKFKSSNIIKNREKMREKLTKFFLGGSHVFSLTCSNTMLTYKTFKIKTVDTSEYKSPSLTNMNNKYG